jgi:hypothetical protein
MKSLLRNNLKQQNVNGTKMFRRKNEHHYVVVVVGRRFRSSCFVTAAKLMAAHVHKSIPIFNPYLNSKKNLSLPTHITKQS